MALLQLAASVGQMEMDDSPSIETSLPTFEHLNAQLIARGYLKTPLRLEGMDPSQRSAFVDMLHLMLSQRTEDLELREAMLAKNRLVGTMLEKAKREREQCLAMSLEAQRKAELSNASNVNLTNECNALKRALIVARSEVTTTRNQLKTLRAASTTARIAAERSNSVVRAHYAEATLAASRGVFPSLDVVPCAFARTGPAPEQSKRSATAEIEGIAARRLDENRSLRRLAAASINGVRAAAHAIQLTLPGSTSKSSAPPPTLGVRDLFYGSAAVGAQSTPFYSLADAKHPAPLALSRATKAIEASASALQGARTREANKHSEDVARANIAVSDRAVEAALRDYLALNPHAGSAIRANGVLPASDDQGRLRSTEPSLAEMERKLIAALTRTQELETENAALLAAGFSTEPAAPAVPSAAEDAAFEALEAQHRELQERLRAADSAADAALLERRRLESERKALEEQRRKEQMDSVIQDKATRAPRVVRLVAPDAMEEEAAFNLAKARGDFLHVTNGTMQLPRLESRHTRVRATPSDPTAETSTSGRRSRSSVGNTSSASFSSTSSTTSRSSRSQHAAFGVVASEANVVIYGPLPPRIRRSERTTADSAMVTPDSSIASLGTRSRPRAAAVAVASNHASANLSRSGRSFGNNVENVLQRENVEFSPVPEPPVPARMEPVEQQPEQHAQQHQRPVNIFDVDHNVAELLRQLGSGRGSASDGSSINPAGRDVVAAPTEPPTDDVVMQDSSSSSRKRSFDTVEAEERHFSSSSSAARRTGSSFNNDKDSLAPPFSAGPEAKEARQTSTARRGAGVGAHTASSLARAVEAKATRAAKAKGTPAAGKLLKSSSAAGTAVAAVASKTLAAASSASVSVAARKKPRLALAPAAALSNQDVEMPLASVSESSAKGKARALDKSSESERPRAAARRVREGRI